MPSWRGDQSNPVPDNVRESINRSNKIIGSNRAEQVRRDNDSQKDFTITLYDIDKTIFEHLNSLQLQVQDVGNMIKVPVFFASPEKWTSAQRDGYIRDEQGKLLLPLIILKRTDSANDESLQYFNRYLNESVIKLYSEKNKYTQFSVLNGQNAPLNEVYNVLFPSHMLLTYHFIIWTEYIEQMNKLVEKIQYNTKDYWGTDGGFKFRTRTENFSHTVDVQADEDRVVKTEFDLMVHGYILPDTVNKLGKNILTTQKRFTNKKIIINAETVKSGKEIEELFKKDREKWRNQNYPNLSINVQIPAPKFDVIEPTFPIVSFTFLSPPELLPQVSYLPANIWNDQSLWWDILAWQD